MHARPRLVHTSSAGGRPIMARPVTRVWQVLALVDLTAETSDSLLRRVCDLGKEVVSGAEEVSVTLLDAGTATTATTGGFARRLDELQHTLGGPSLTAATGGQPQFIADAHAEGRWPRYLRQACPAGLASSLSLPVPVRSGTAAALSFYSRTSQSFTGDDVDAAQQLAANASVALRNIRALEAAHQHVEQLQTAMASRAVIEQAKGVLMAADRCSSVEAFNILVQVSKYTNRKLRAVAQAIVDAAAREPDRHGLPVGPCAR